MFPYSYHMDTPKTLLEAINFFSEYENCRQYMISVRWEDCIVRCPTCGSDSVKYMETAKLYNCRTKHAKQKFSLKVGTIYEDSAISLEKWLPATWLLTNCKNGISSYELARAIGVTQKSAWHMLHRIRKAMEVTGDLPKMGGEGKVCVTDETFVGGKVTNMHHKRLKAMKKEVRPARVQAYNTTYGEKIAVQGIFDKGSREMRAKVVPNVRRATLQKEILANIEFGSTIHTDEAVWHKSLKEQYVHETVNHAIQYVRKGVSTNAVENFWSLLKRNLNGTYVAVEPFHLDRYLAEQCFRFNTSKTMNDAARFRKALTQTVGKRLTYAEVTGKVSERA